MSVIPLARPPGMRHGPRRGAGEARRLKALIGQVALLRKAGDGSEREVVFPIIELPFLFFLSVADCVASSTRGCARRWRCPVLLRTSICFHGCSAPASSSR